MVVINGGANHQNVAGAQQGEASADFGRCHEDGHDVGEGRLGGFVEGGTADGGREEGDAQAVPHEGADDGGEDEEDDFVAEGVVGEGRQLDDFVDLIN